MSHPSHEDIAQALGIKNNEVKQLAKRGMPLATVSKARAWFEINGFRYHDNVPHGIRISKTRGPR